MVSTGSLCKRLPVAPKIAFVTAGTMAEVPGLAHPARRLGTLDDVDLDDRRLVDAQKLIGIEIALLDAAALQRDLAIARNSEAQSIPVEGEAAVGIPDHDRRVVDAEAQLVARTVSFWVALALGKLENLQMVAVGVLEVESSMPPASGFQSADVAGRARRAAPYADGATHTPEL